MAATFRLSIITPEHRFFEGDVESLVIKAPDGDFCILADHEPMVVTVAEGEIHIVVNGQTRWAAASGGFATVTQDEVFVMLQTCEWPEEIDIRRAERDRRAAQEILRQKRSMQEYVMAKSMLARAMVRLQVKSRRGVNN